MRISVIIAGLAIFLNNAYGGGTSTTHGLNATIDMVAPHLWRGLKCGSGPSVEPSVTYKKENFSGGIWAAHCFNNSYNELDLWAGYTYKSCNVTFFDYFCPPAYELDKADFTDFHGKDTYHFYSLDLSFLGTDKIPVNLLVSTMFLGADFDVENNRYYYSTYIQAGYNYSVKKYNFNVFAGGTPAKGGYALHPAVINTGVSCSTRFEFSKNINVPMKLSAVYNPDQKQFYLSVSVSLSTDFEL